MAIGIVVGVVALLEWARFLVVEGYIGHNALIFAHFPLRGVCQRVLVCGGGVVGCGDGDGGRG